MMSSTNPKQNKGGTQRVGGQKTGSRAGALGRRNSSGAQGAGAHGRPEASPQGRGQAGRRGRVDPVPGFLSTSLRLALPESRV